MSVRRTIAGTAFPRRAALAFAAGLLMGAVHWLLHIASPAPPLIGLTGLLGIVIGERATGAARARRRRRRHARPPSTPSGTEEDENHAHRPR